MTIEDMGGARYLKRKVMRPLESAGLTIEPASHAMVLTPNDNGTWHITSEAFPALTMHFKDQTMSLKSSSYKFDGIYDPKTFSFSTASANQEGVTLDQDTPVLTQHQRTGKIAFTQTSTPNDDHSVSIAAHYVASEMTNQTVMHMPAPKASVEVAPAPAPVEFSYSIPTAAADVAIDKLHSSSLLDLWAYFVAHPGKDAITASQEELRGLLRGALPLLGGLKEAASVDGMTITTQMGAFSAHKFASSIELSDLAGSGKAAMAIAFDGLSVPGAELPPWTTGLIPTAADIKPSVTGFHFDAAAKEAVEDFDLKNDGFTPDQA